MSKTAQKIGWIGVGRMGTPMVERLLKAGHQVTVWNRTRAKAESNGWRVYDVPCGHDVMVDMPERLVEILIEVA